MLLYLLGPAGAGCGHFHGEYLACAWLPEHALGTIPFGRDQEQDGPVGASERAREAAAVKLDGLEHIATLDDARAALVRNIRIPHGVLGVGADSVRNPIA